MTRPRGVLAPFVLPVAALLVLGAPVAAVAQEDPYRPQQWNLDRVGAPDAWAAARGEGQVIAIVDSGVDLAHPDLVDRFVRDDDGQVVGIDVVDEDDDPADRLGHGTMVAGIAAAEADNGIGMAGLAPQAQILPVRVLDEEGGGSSADVDAGIRWAVDHGATVVNLSLESAGRADGPDLGGLTAPVEAVEYAAEHGVVVVAAAGNSGNAFTDYPPDSPVVLVGATDQDDGRAEFSDSGRDDLLMAPGVEIVSTWCRAADSDACDGETHNYGIADGTSFAAPSVAGAIAVLRSLGLDGPEAVQVLRDTALDLEEPGRDDGTGHGRIDLAAAVATASAPTPSASPSTGPTASSTGRPSAAPDPTPSGPASPTPTGPVSASPTSADPTPSVSPAPPPYPPPAAPSGPTAAPPPAPAGRGGWVMVAAALLAGACAAQVKIWLGPADVPVVDQ